MDEQAASCSIGCLSWVAILGGVIIIIQSIRSAILGRGIDPGVNFLAGVIAVLFGIMLYFLARSS